MYNLYRAWTQFKIGVMYHIIIHHGMFFRIETFFQKINIRSQSACLVKITPLICKICVSPTNFRVLIIPCSPVLHVLSVSLCSLAQSFYQEHKYNSPVIFLVLKFSMCSAFSSANFKCNSTSYLQYSSSLCALQMFSTVIYTHCSTIHKNILIFYCSVIQS